MICGWCYSAIKKENRPVIISGMNTEKRCECCGRLCYGYNVTDRREVDLEDNTRRPGDYKKGLSEV